MPDINDLFNRFPDYDVFTGKTTPPKKRRVRRTQPVPAPQPMPQRSPTDYGDDYGKYKEKKRTRGNYMTVFFFPLALVWMEFFMKLATRVEQNFVSAIYTFLFLMPIACVLTLLCTFGSEKLNRILCNVFTFLLTALFEFQLIYFGKYSALFTISGAKSGSVSFGDAWTSITQNALCFIALLIPFLFSITVGRFVFTFRKIRIPAKISLVLVAVLFQILAITAVSFSRNNKSPISSYKLYNTTFNAAPSQERFGLLTTEYLDIKNSLS